MPEPSAVPKLIVELEKIQKWRKERLANHQRYLGEIDEEDNRLRQKLAELERKLKANSQLREQVLNQLRKLPLEEGQRSHAALKEALLEDRELLEKRAAALTHVLELRRVELQRQLADPEVAKAIEEYEKFQEVRPTLDVLPASYRTVIESHHRILEEKLRPLFELADGIGVDLDTPPTSVGIVASLDPEEGPPAAFALLVPVDFEVYRDWINRQEDLSAQLAYRSVAAITRLLGRLDAASAPVAYRNFHDCLSIQVWLGNHTVKGDVRKLAAEALEEMKREALELVAAHVNVQTVWVSPFTIAPDEEEDAGGREEAVVLDPTMAVNPVPPAPVVAPAAPPAAPPRRAPRPGGAGAGRCCCRWRCRPRRLQAQARQGRAPPWRFRRFLAPTREANRKKRKPHGHI